MNQRLLELAMKGEKSKMTEFTAAHRELLQRFAAMSAAAGARSDYVQGGGGNTSVKLPGGLMAIKASGYCLSDVTAESGYAVLDGAALRQFYETHEAADFTDAEQAGAACCREHTKTIEGLPALRPSVEAGFHSLLDTFVCHTHSVYANLACCARSCRAIAERAFAGADYAWGWVPYTDPGAHLTFAVRDELRRVQAQSGRRPAVILMQNHGIIVHDDDERRCLAIHKDANERVAQQFGLHDGSFPPVAVKELAEGLYAADAPALTAALASGRYDYETLLAQPLYPDQMVFLTGTLFENKRTLADGEASVDFSDGSLLMRMSARRARTLTETLAAVVFIRDTLQAAGCPLSTMGEAARQFIANWESERYRKSLAK